MRIQFDYMGGPTPQSTGLLVCPRCEDAMDTVNKLLILPPDPAPFKNTRPEVYAIDEAGPDQDLAAIITGDGPTIGASFYLDLYDGDPDQGGDSVLSTLTGSATRTNYASVMAASGSLATNDTAITITETAEASAVVAWLVIFDAATAGNRRMDGQLTVPQTVTLYNGAAFAVGALQVRLV